MISKIVDKPFPYNCQTISKSSSFMRLPFSSFKIHIPWNVWQKEKKFNVFISIPLSSESSMCALGVWINCYTGISLAAALCVFPLSSLLPQNLRLLFSFQLALDQLQIEVMRRGEMSWKDFFSLQMCMNVILWQNIEIKGCIDFEAWNVAWIWMT